MQKLLTLKLYAGCSNCQRKQQIEQWDKGNLEWNLEWVNHNTENSHL